MTPVVFPSEEALRLALTAGLVPREVQRAPARYARVADGAIAVWPRRAIADRALQRLRQVLAPDPSRLDAAQLEVGCWAEIVRPTKVPEPAGRLVVLFVMQGGSDAALPLLQLAGEMLRLGCDRQELRSVRQAEVEIGMVRATDPPYFTVARALDRVAGLFAFVPTPPGQDRIWTEIGFEHPLASTFEPPAGILLIDAQGRWQSLEDGSWTDLYERIDLEVPGSKALEVETDIARLVVPLRLARAARPQAPTLWVLRDDPTAKMDAIVQGLPEETLARFSYAVARGEQPVVALRARPGKKGAPAAFFPGESYAPLLEIPNLLAPADRTIDPPIRRDRLRALLAPDPDRVTWLRALEGGRFEPESIAESAFHPLSEWVDYVADAGARTLEGWVRGATFDFAAFESADDDPRQPRVPDPPDRSTRARNANRGAARPPAAAPTSPRPPRARAQPKATAEGVEAPPSRPEVSALEVELADAEAAFLELDAPADDPARTPLWLRMAELSGRLGRMRDASLCWTRALWETSGDEALRLAARWAAAEIRAVGESDGAALLSRTTPTRDEIRALAAQVVLRAQAAGSPPAESSELHAVQIWLDAHDDCLDVRSLWLARAALARLAGGDRLALAAARDRVLAKLNRGLRLELDVPRFLRFAGDAASGRGRESAAMTRLVGELEDLLTRFERTRRTRSAVEAPPERTLAYVHLVFAYGFARLGQADRARALRVGAQKALDLEDPVNGFLVSAYAARVDQALEGQPADAPLPPELSGRLDALESFSRYKVDRLRQASTVLEPQERLDPVGAFHRRARDPRGDEFAGLRGQTDPQALEAGLEPLIARASGPGVAPDDRLRLLDGALDFLPLLSESRAVPLLERMMRSISDIPPERRVLVLEDALRVAGHFGRQELVRELTRQLADLLAGMAAEHMAVAAHTLGACLSALRRVGLREEAAVLLESAAKAASGTGARAVAARVTLAGGFAHLGLHDRAEPVFAQGMTALSESGRTMTDRLVLTRALAAALSQAQQATALAGLRRLADQLPSITDSFNTNSHFCLSLLELADALVLGYASDDLALGETGRRLLEEDEYLVRRRVHRELANRR